MAENDIIHSLDEYLSRMDEGQLICRARHRHNWPSDTMRVGRKMPKGIETTRQNDGSYLVVEYCSDCGKECSWMTKPRGVWDYQNYRRYKDPERWVRIPREVDYKSADLKAAHFELIRDMLFK